MKKKIVCFMLALILGFSFQSLAQAKDKSTTIDTTNLLRGTVQGLKSAIGNKNRLLLNKTDLKIVVDGEFTIELKNQNLQLAHSYSTSDDSVITVDSKTGLIKAIKDGQAVITCEITTNNEKTVYLTCNVTVYKEIDISEEDLLKGAIEGIKKATGK